jgi:hypothetical protein
MTVTDELLQNNQRYAERFDKGDLSLPPAKGVAVVACMDARLHVSKILGLSEGDAHIIRNAGGVVTDDEIRSLRSRSGCWARGRSSSSTTQTAACSRSRTMSSVARSRRRPGCGPSGRPGRSRTWMVMGVRTSRGSRRARSSRTRTAFADSSTKSRRAGCAKSRSRRADAATEPTDVRGHRL